VNFRRAVDLYFADMQSAGRINSERTVEGYARVLHAHADDIGNRDPRTVGRDDCKRTLARWEHPNTQAFGRSVLVSFYDWTVEEGMRPANPARQTRRPRRRPATVYRLTREEAVRLLDACADIQDTRAIYLGLCAGLRSAELRGMRGRHFERDGFVRVTADIGKGKKERYIPIVDELAPIVADIQSTCALEHYVLTARRSANPPMNTHFRDVPTRPMSAQSLWNLVGRMGVRAGISEPLHPHLLRHAFGDHIARHGGLKVAQALMGHADVKTTRGYVDNPKLDELAVAVRGLRFDAGRVAPRSRAL
jgi:integrase